MTNTKNKVVEFSDLGHVDYKKALELQTSFFDLTVARKIANRREAQELPTSNYLLFCSHPHVYTLGKSGDENNLLISPPDRKRKKIAYFHTNRGGDITYHGPGQIVGYPILDLENFFTDIHLYLRNLEEGVIRTLYDYGLEARRIEGLTGVWLGDTNDPRKICALGVKTSRWVTMHGFAFNVNVDLEYYDYIIPCGIDDKAVTSLDKELGRTIDVAETKQILVKHLADIFQMEIVHGK